jgi:hypothetical protein
VSLPSRNTLRGSGAAHAPVATEPQGEEEAGHEPRAGQDAPRQGDDRFGKVVIVAVAVAVCALGWVASLILF